MRTVWQEEKDKQMAGWTIFIVLCGLLAIMDGESFLTGALSPVLLFGGIALAVWCYRRTARQNERQRTLKARSTQCRKCGQMVTPQYASRRGKASYNCPCGHSWTTAW